MSSTREDPAPTRCFREDCAKKWMWSGLIAFIALQIYFVQEMLAALALFCGVFVLFAALALVLFILDRVSMRALVWVGSQSRRSGCTEFCASFFSTATNVLGSMRYWIRSLTNVFAD